MEVIQTFTNGTTIEFGVDSHGNQVHRICTPSGSMCRFAESNHVAQSYACQFEENYRVKPDSL
jgi:hypothetical protein